MVLVAVVDNDTVQKVYKTAESLADINNFLGFLHPDTKVVPVTAQTGFPQTGYTFDGEKFITEAA